MKGLITEENQGRVFCHQCPVCRMWQVDYTEWVFLIPHTLRVNALTQITEPDLTLCHQMVEDVVVEHYKAEHPEEYAALMG